MALLQHNKLNQSKWLASSRYPQRIKILFLDLHCGQACDSWEKQYHYYSTSIMYFTICHHWTTTPLPWKPCTCWVDKPSEWDLAVMCIENLTGNSTQAALKWLTGWHYTYYLHWVPPPHPPSLPLPLLHCKKGKAAWPDGWMLTFPFLECVWGFFWVVLVE